MLTGLAVVTRSCAQGPPDPWRPRTVPAFGASYAPDIGLLLGAGIIHTRYGFHALPPTTRALAEAQYATAARSYRVNVAAEFRPRGPPTTFNVAFRASGLELIRFYGIGNQTNGSRADSAYRVRAKQIQLAPSVTVPVAARVRLTTGPLLEYTRTSADPGSLLATTGPYYGAGAFGQLGLHAILDFDTRDSPTAPARGVHLTAGGQWHPALWHVVSPFGSCSAEAATYFSADDPASVTLALRAGGAAVAGTVPFQEFVYVGGETTVRGYAEQRFTGRRGAYANVELRLAAGRLPFGDVGLFGLADGGRVWVPGEVSDRWHAAAGGGVWLAWQHRRANILSIAAARSPERTAAYLRAGFLF